MDLKSMTNALRIEALGEAYRRRFDEAKGYHSVLAHHEDVASVLAVLSDESQQRYWEREAITRALVVEHQRRPHPLWSAVLVVAYYPMLLRLRVRTVSDAMSPEELDQQVVACFLEVLERIPMEPKRDRTCVRLRSKTRKRLFRLLRKEQGRQDRLYLRDTAGLLDLEQQQFELGDPEEMACERASLWPGTRRPIRAPRNERDQAAKLRFLTELIGDGLNPEDVELLITTLVRGETVANFSRLFSRGMPAVEKRRIYERIKRRHSRALARLRAMVAERSVPESDQGGIASIGAPKLARRIERRGSESDDSNRQGGAIR